jgi:hypothetical protein
MYGRLANNEADKFTKPPSTATARYTRYVTVKFDNGVDAKEFFYQLNEQLGYDPRV